MKRTPLRKVSKKRRSQLGEYSKLRRDYMKAHPICAMCNNAKASDIHHRNGRNGDRLNNTVFWVSLCRSCHTYIHDHPGFARDHGWLI